jgi:hypothetical protein
MKIKLIILSSLLLIVHPLIGQNEEGLFNFSMDTALVIQPAHNASKTMKRRIELAFGKPIFYRGKPKTFNRSRNGHTKRLYTIVEFPNCYFISFYEIGPRGKSYRVAVVDKEIKLLYLIDSCKAINIEDYKIFFEELSRCNAFTTCN